MCMAKKGRQMMSHLPLKATLLLHTVVHLLSQCTLEVDFAQEKFKNISFFSGKYPLSCSILRISFKSSFQVIFSKGAF